MGRLLAISGVALALAVSAGASFAVQRTEPEFVAPVFKEPTADTRVNVDAAKLIYDGKRKIATATGEVRITYGPYTLVASKVVYDLKHDKLTANGSVELREPNGNILQAATIELHNKFKEGFAAHLKALLTNDVTITARYAKRYENGVTVYENATYTACKDCETKSGKPLWQLVTEETKHDEAAKTLYHKNAKLEIGGVPVFWVPYFEQADPTVKRRTGWLLPDLRTRHAYGIGLVTPYFWAPAPNYDVTFRPVWSTSQLGVADVEWRHRLKTGQYNIRGYGVYELTKQTDGERWRGALTSEGNFALNQDWSYGWDGTLVSDRKFLDDYDFDKRDLATDQIYVKGLHERNYVLAQALAFETLTDTGHNGDYPAALPYIQSNYTFDQPFLGGELGFDTSVYSLVRDDPSAPFATVNHGTDQSRAVASLRWQNQMTTDMGQVITPFARLRSDVYINKNVPDGLGGFRDEETSSRVLPMAGVDVRWPFISQTGFGSSIIEPAFQLIAATNETDQAKIGNEDSISVNFDQSSLFLHDRFTGLDRYEGGTRANLGVVYSLLGDGGAFLKASLGESFHIAGVNSFAASTGLDGPKSDLVGAITAEPNDYLRLSYQARVEEDLSRINAQEAAIGLTFDRFAASVSYVDLAASPSEGRVENLEQAWGDVSFQFNEAWSVFGGMRYDLANDKFLKKSVGVAFDCDCMNAKLTYSETRNTDTSDEVDHRVMFSVELRTIGKTGVSASF